MRIRQNNQIFVKHCFVCSWPLSAKQNCFFFSLPYQELANQAHIFAIMELACACVDAAEDPFPGERQYISQCLEDVKAQQEQIASLVQQASELLKEILQHEGVDYLKGRQFDNVVREAKVQIESCKRRLTGAEEAISKLSKKTGTVKWTKRGVRAGCMLYKCDSNQCHSFKYLKHRD